MEFGISSDSNKEAKLSEIELWEPLEEYFAEKYYDDSRIAIFIVLMCRSPYLNFKQRTRFVKADNCLYTDIMLDYGHMTTTDTTARKRHVAEKLITEVPQIIAKYKFRDFDLKRFSSDLRHWFENQGWIDKVGRM